MQVLDLLEPRKLRTALLSLETSKQECINLARLVAAYYLGFPLFNTENGMLPSLFLWSQIQNDGLPSRSTPLSRDYLASVLPPEYSPRFPVVLLTACQLDIEAVLYSDYFNDRRSSLLLRIYADNIQSLSLTNSFISDLCLSVLPSHIDRIIEKSNQLGTDIDNLSENFIQSLLELDVVLQNDFLLAFENQLIDKIEFLFAELPIQSDEVEGLPRAPVYSLPEVCKDGGENIIHTKMYIYIKFLLQLLRKSNRLTAEVTKSISIVSENSNQRPYSVLTRLAIIILAVIYRDEFSLAVAQEWKELPEVALKYKSLLPDEEDLGVYEPIARWKSLADEADFEHLNTFFQFVRENFSDESQLAVLTSFTREVWYKSLLERGETQLNRQHNTDDWLSGLIHNRNKVDRSTFDRLHFVAFNWTSVNLFDPSLISVRLALSPNDLCSPKPSSVPTLVERTCMSAREERAEDSNPPSKRLFSTREDLVAIYARKGREYLARRDREKKKKNKNAQYLKNTLRGGLEQISNTQKTIEKEVDDEKSFLDDISLPSSKSSIYPSDSVHKEQVRQLWDDAIRIDLNRLNQKLDKISKHLRGSTGSSLHSHKTETDDESNEPDVSFRNEVQNNELEELEGPSFNYDEVSDVAGDFPEMERLDFSVLTPMPSVGNRVASPATKEKTIPEYNPVPNWMRLLPLQNTVSARPRLLNDTFRSKKTTASTERGIQTDDRPSSMPNFDNSPTEQPKLQKIPGMRIMSKEEIAKLLRSSS